MQNLIPLITQAEQYLHQLSPDRLRVVVNLLASLNEENTLPSDQETATGLNVMFCIPLPEHKIPEEIWSLAQQKAREAFIMELLRHGSISAGRTARLLGVDRWQLSDLMNDYNISPFPELTQEELRQEITGANLIKQGKRISPKLYQEALTIAGETQAS